MKSIILQPVGQLFISFSFPQSLLAYKTRINSRRSQLIIMASHTQNFSPCVRLWIHQFNWGSLEHAARRPQFSPLSSSY